MANSPITQPYQQTQKRLLKKEPYYSNNITHQSNNVQTKTTETQERREFLFETSASDAAYFNT